MHCATNNTCVYRDYVRDTKTKESQTEDNIHLVQKCETELQEGKAIIENQSRQIEELNRKILSLENKLENSNATINSLDWKVRYTLTTAMTDYGHGLFTCKCKL